MIENFSYIFQNYQIIDTLLYTVFIYGHNLCINSHFSLYISCKTMIFQICLPKLFLYQFCLNFCSQAQNVLKFFFLILWFKINRKHNLDTNLNLNVTKYYTLIVFLNFKISSLYLNHAKLKARNKIKWRLCLTEISVKLVKKYLCISFQKMWLTRNIYIGRNWRWRTIMSTYCRYVIVFVHLCSSI